MFRVIVLTLILYRSTWAVSGNVTTATPSTVPDLDASSCQDRCVEKYFPGKVCYCNSACNNYENCCYDFYRECQPDRVWGDSWVDYNDHSYRYFEDNTATSVIASKQCYQQGGMLVSINDQGELDFLITDVIKKRTMSVFIGAKNQPPDVQWVWADGGRMPLPSSSGWHVWYSGEPDSNTGLETCALLTNYKFWAVRKVSFGSYFWVDFRCDSNGKQVQGYICERTLECEPNPCQNNGTCRYVGGEREYLCECPQGFVGTNCEIQLIDGELWTRCGETSLLGPQGQLTSPLYPEFYPPNVRCVWTVTVSDGNTISLRFLDKEIESGKDCAFDSIRVFDGPDTNGSLLLEPVCGSNSPQLEKPIPSYSNVVTIAFHSDSTIQLRGFHLTYTEDKCGRGSGSSGCGTGRHLEASCGTVEVLSGPVDGETACYWEIVLPANHIVNLTFTEFWIEDTDIGCQNGSLTVHDGGSEEAMVIERYCGRRFPWSLTSSGPTLYIVLTGLDWQLGQHVIKMEYQSIDSSEVKITRPQTVVEGHLGAFSSQTAPVYLETSTQLVYRWLVRVPVGDFVTLQWKSIVQEGSSLQVFDGCCEESVPLVAVLLNTRDRDGVVQGSSFQVLVLVTRQKVDVNFLFNATYVSRGWTSELSGCYRPLYTSRVDSAATENSLVSPTRPLVIKATKDSHGAIESGYQPGTYCKWTMRGEPGSSLVLVFSELVLPRHGTTCDADGVVVYGASGSGPNNNNKYGPFCGSSKEVQSTRINLNTDMVTVVLYADSQGQVREDAVFRALVMIDEQSSCRLDEMSVEPVTVRMTSECGVVLSPGLPAEVRPGLWTWMIAPPVGHYFKVLLSYVQGPAIRGECSSFLRLLETGKSSGKFRHWEADVLKICQDASLFLPEASINLPYEQKLGVELSTVAGNRPQRWEFKLSYSSEKMHVPKMFDERGRCGEDYVYYGGHCYRYFSWYLRQVQPRQHKYLETWQSARDQCHAQNASMLSIMDEKEAYFVKYALSTRWLWDQAGTWQTNHRLIYLGLHNIYGPYVWDNGANMAYTDWYRPMKPWQQPVVHPDTLVTHLLHLRSGQPSADLGSLCVVMLATSPHGSLNWAKVPCDYPLHRASLICKKPAATSATNIAVQNVEDLSKPYQTCPNGWIKYSDHCVQLHTNYKRVIARHEGQKVKDITQDEAEGICRRHGGQLESLPRQVPPLLVDLMYLWRSDETMGHIRIAQNGTVCRLLKVFRVDDSENTAAHRIDDTPCQTTDQYGIYSVLCRTQTIVTKQSCGDSEFKCEDNSCIGVDFVCDGRKDCPNNTDERNCSCGDGMFRCSTGRCISMSLYCDFTDNCGDNSDERACVAEKCRPDEFQCDSGQCIEIGMACDFRKDCKDGSDENPETCEGQCKGFQCYSGLCVRSDLRRDIVSDCPGLALEDEAEDRQDLETMRPNTGVVEDTVVTNDTVYVGCSEGWDFSQCRPNHPKCFRRSQTCVFDRVLVDAGRGTEVQSGCRDGSHLRNTCGSFECPGMFHCPGSYCVPYNRVCDGVNDCPYGRDEHAGCRNNFCPGMMRCKGHLHCLPRDKVCDGEVHCSNFGEDEKYCTNQDIICGTQCPCVGNVATCSNRNITALAGPDSARTRQLRAILLPHNNVNILNDTFQGLHWLGILDLSFNSIERLEADVFSDLQNLFDLDLSHNKLLYVDSRVLHGLVSLRWLDLTHNHLAHVDRDTFSPLSSLLHLVLNENPLDYVTQDAFSSLKSLRELNTDAFKFCCIAKQVEVCTPDADEFSSCEDLMANFPLQVSIWILGMCAFVGNLFVVIWRTLSERSKVSSFFIINLGMADFLMGIYLLIIACVDVYYRGEYIVHSDRWRASGLCQLGGILAMLSSEVSVFTLCAITGDRLFTILFPFKAGSFRIKQARMMAVGIWLTGFFLSILPTMDVTYFGNAFFGRTGVCLPFHLSKERLPGWEYSVFVFLVLNFVAFLFVFVGYVTIFMSVRSSIQDMAAKSTATMDEYALAKKLSIIVATDFMCWVPIILIGFAALGGASIPPQMAAWVAVFILPLNSAVNPILYTLSAINCNRRGRRGAASSIGMSTKMSAVSTVARRDTSGVQGTNDSSTNVNPAAEGKTTLM